MKNFRTYHLAVSFYKQVSSEKTPRHLKEQLLRAAASIPLNLAEGAGRATKADQVRFFHIAFGSVRECQAILTLAGLSSSPVNTMLDSLAAHTYRLIHNAR